MIMVIINDGYDNDYPFSPDFLSKIVNLKRLICLESIVARQGTILYLMINVFIG